MRDENTPVIVGTGQLVDREADLERHIEPLEMLIRAARDAADDAGGGQQLLQQLDTVALVGIAGWHPPNPPNMVARALGAYPAREYTTGTGGQVGITLMNHIANAIVEGRSELALVAGCNNLKVLMKAIGANKTLQWQRGGAGEPTMIGGDEPGSNELEGAYGLKQPPEVYPLFENALRAKHGLSIETHKQRMGNLFSKFTEVAANNPYAWFPVQRSPGELTTVTPQNRMVAFPYPKYLNAVLNTEQAAGLIVCSAARARAMGIPEDKWVYWLGGANSQERAWWPSERPDFTRCPSMKDTHLSTLESAGIGVNAIDYFDFYSCFPIAVEMACEMLGLDIDDPRGFTVTGGLPYAGGPASAYTLHSLADMTKRLAGTTGKHGLVTGNGWYLTKHSAAVLSSSPKQDGLPVEGLIDNLPSNDMETAPQTVDLQPQGKGTAEAYTVVYNREGEPERGIVLGKTTGGKRFLANTPNDIRFLESFVAEEQVGTVGALKIKEDRVIFMP